MKRATAFAAVSAAAVMATSAMAQSPLFTADPNNGSGGVFFNLTDLTASGLFLSVTQFDVAYTGTVGTAVDVEVWTRPGSYVGFESDPTGWTLTQTVGGTRQGSSVLDPLVLSSPLTVGDGQTLAVYIHAITSGGGVRYNGTGANPPLGTWANADVELFGEVARTGSTPFAGSMFTPRSFAGNVHYRVVPTPATMALMGLGGLVALRRRR